MVYDYSRSGPELSWHSPPIAIVVRRVVGTAFEGTVQTAIGEEIDAELGGERAQILDGREVHGNSRIQPLASALLLSLAREHHRFVGVDRRRGLYLRHELFEAPFETFTTLERLGRDRNELMSDIEMPIVLEHIRSEQSARHDAGEHVGPQAQAVAFVLPYRKERAQPSPRRASSSGVRPASVPKFSASRVPRGRASASCLCRSS